MKKVLSILLLSAISWGVTPTANVQGVGEPDKADRVVKEVKSKIGEEKMMPEPAVQLNRLTKGLLLTEEQQNQIKPLLEDEYAKLKAIRQNEDISPKQIQKKVEELRSDTISKINKCLTQEQQNKYKMVSNEIKANKQQRMKGNRKDRIGTKGDQIEQPK